jgi:hypothetical protein
MCERQEVEPSEVMGVAPIQTQALLKARLRFLGASRVERCHTKHQVSEGKAWAEIDRPLRRSSRLLEFAGGAARNREPVMGIGVLLVEADGGESGRKALLADSGVLIGPTPENDPARHPRQPNVRFRELGEKRSAPHVENERTKGEPGGYGLKLSEVCKISGFFGAQFKTFPPWASDPAAVDAMSANRGAP